MQLWPAIDLLGGKAVRLHKGQYDSVTVYHDDPVSLARSWRPHTPHLHVVDLEGSRRGLPVERDLVRAIVEAFGDGVEVAGGVRDRAAIDTLVGLGASRVVLGTLALRDPALVMAAARDYPGKIVLAVDAKDGFVATEGWLAVSSRTSVEVVRDFAGLPLAAVLYTDVSRDGTRVGPNIEATVRLGREGGFPVLASGGVGSLDDLRELSRHPEIAGAVVGRALYENVFTLEEAVAAAQGETHG